MGVIQEMVRRDFPVVSQESLKTCGIVVCVDVFEERVIVCGHVFRSDCISVYVHCVCICFIEQFTDHWWVNAYGIL